MIIECRRSPGTLVQQAALLGMAAILVVACGGRSTTVQAEPGGQVRGMVLELVDRSITEVETLRVQDEAGKIWAFVGVEGFIGTSPSHVREHQLMGLSVLVTYVRKGDKLVATTVGD